MKDTIDTNAWLSGHLPSHLFSHGQQGREAEASSKSTVKASEVQKGGVTIKRHPQHNGQEAMEITQLS